MSKNGLKYSVGLTLNVDYLRGGGMLVTPADDNSYCRLQQVYDVGVTLLRLSTLFSPLYVIMESSTISPSALTRVMLLKLYPSIRFFLHSDYLNLFVVKKFVLLLIK